MGNTRKVFGNFYLAKHEMLLTERAGKGVTGQIKFCLDQKAGQEIFQTSEDKYIVGIYSYGFKYPDDDHHVKIMSLKIEPELSCDSDGIQEINVTVTGEMSDASNHSSNTLQIGLSLVAIADNAQTPEVGEEIVELVALQEFRAEFSGSGDHHVKEYSARISSDGIHGAAQIADASSHTGTGTASGKKMKAPASLLGLMVAEDVQFINDFKLAKDSGDHHVLHTGIKYINGHAEFDLSDDSKNFASINCCHCYANTYKHS